jgi:hypothetical protein
MHANRPTVSSAPPSAAPRLLAVNGQDPAIYQRFEAIGRPLPVHSIRVSTGPDRPWIDASIDHLPTAAELAAIVAAAGTDAAEGVVA